MKTPLLFIFSILCIFLFTNCSDDNDSDTTVEIKASIWHEYVDYYPPFVDSKVKGIKIKEQNSNEWVILGGLEGLDYEEGYDYVVRLQKTTLADPPQDASSISYKLLEVLEKNKIAVD